MRQAWGWPLALWDLVGAVVGVYYWTLRRNYSSLMQGAKLFEDLRQREQQALEINDNVLQGTGRGQDGSRPRPAARRPTRALTTAIDSASKMITDLLGNDALLGRAAAQRAGPGRGVDGQRLRSARATGDTLSELDAGRRSAPRVLVVDDTPDLRDLLRFALKRHGFEVVGEAGNGREGIERGRPSCDPTWSCSTWRCR